MSTLLGGNPLDHIKESQLKIIDFNVSRMFNLDDSPFRIRKRQRTQSKEITDEQMWKEMSELPSPLIFRGGNNSLDRQEEESKKPASCRTPTFCK